MRYGVRPAVQGVTCSCIRRASEALLVAALIEGEVRQAVANAALDTIELYPGLRAAGHPPPNGSWRFTTVSRHDLHHDGVLVRTFQPELSA